MSGIVLFAVDVAGVSVGRTACVVADSRRRARWDGSVSVGWGREMHQRPGSAILLVSVYGIRDESRSTDELVPGGRVVDGRGLSTKVEKCGPTYFQGDATTSRELVG